MPRWTLSIIGVAVLAAGCSKPPTLTEFDDPTTVVAAPTSAPATTQPATTVAPTTVPPTVPPTIPSTAPTTLSTDALTAEVTAAFAELEATMRSCASSPIDCDVRSIAVEYGPAFDFWKLLFQGWVDRGEALRVDPRSRWAVKEIRFGTLPGEATVEACVVDADLLVKVGDPATQADDVVLDDRVLSRMSEFTLSKTDDGWRVFAGDRSQDLGEGDLCG